MSGATSKESSTLCWPAAPTIAACALMSGLRNTRTIFEPTARKNAGIEPTANNSAANNEETPAAEAA